MSQSRGHPLQHVDTVTQKDILPPSTNFIPQVPAIISRLNQQGASLINRSNDINSHIHHPVNDECRVLSYGESSEGSRDYEDLRQFFLHAPPDVVRRTYDASSQ